MKKIYLIRHAMPDFPNGQRQCLGKTDIPLGTFGRMQAALLGEMFVGKDITVLSSPLSRAVETAVAIKPDIHILPELSELGAGEWEGLTFDEIRARYPKLYEERGINPTLPIPGAEPDEPGLMRMKAAIVKAEQIPGDVAIVSHAGLMSLILEEYTGSRTKPWYGSVTTLSGSRLVSLSKFPHPELTDSCCEKLLHAAGAPENVIAHCFAVADKAETLAAQLGFDAKSIRAAALLHDIARAEPRHAAVGAEWLSELGYQRVADLIKLHHGHHGDRLDEAAVLYYADKRVSETRVVTLDERFEKSLIKCETERERQFWNFRRNAAEKIEKQMIKRGIEL